MTTKAAETIDTIQQLQAFVRIANTELEMAKHFVKVAGDNFLIEMDDERRGELIHLFEKGFDKADNSSEYFKIVLTSVKDSRVLDKTQAQIISAIENVGDVRRVRRIRKAKMAKRKEHISASSNGHKNAMSDEDVVSLRNLRASLANTI